jgi:hypothetical protein
MAALAAFYQRRPLADLCLCAEASVTSVTTFVVAACFPFSDSASVWFAALII